MINLTKTPTKVQSIIKAFDASDHFVLDGQDECENIFNVQDDHVSFILDSVDSGTYEFTFDALNKSEIEGNIVNVRNINGDEISIEIFQLKPFNFKID